MRPDLEAPIEALDAFSGDGGSSTLYWVYKLLHSLPPVSDINQGVGCCYIRLWRPKACMRGLTDILEKWLSHASEKCCLSCPRHDDVMKWKHFPRYWPFLRGIHRSPVNSPRKGQWRGTLMFSLICVWIIGWVNNREACELRHYWAHYDVIVMSWEAFSQHQTTQTPIISDRGFSGFASSR